MNKEEIRSVVYKSISDVCSIQIEDINDESSLKEDLNIKSIDALTLLAMIEDQLEVELEDSAFIVLTYVKDIVNYLCSIINEKE